VIDNLIRRRESFAVVTVLRVEGSGLGEPGLKEIISSRGGVLCGSLGGVCPDSAITGIARVTLETGQAKVVKVFLGREGNATEPALRSTGDEIHVDSDHDGSMEIYIEPHLPQQRLIIVGRGGRDEVEDDLVKLGKMTHFEVVVIDHDPELSEQPDQIISDLDFDLASFKFFRSDAVAVLTHGDGDANILADLSRAGVGYVGLMGSRQRVAGVLEELRKLGISEQFIQSIHAPIGIDMGSVTASEIALSIVAEILALKRGKTLPRRGAAPPVGVSRD